jgi:TolB-like protein
MADSPELVVAPPAGYRIERELGRGGMATVYLARDLKHDRLVALKVLRPELAQTLGPDRFLREVHLTAQLQHPNILPVFDSGSTATQLWYSMPYILGESLRGRLQREIQLPIEEAVRIGCAVGEALDHAHRQGVVHRDIKPENILLAEQQVLVADFGVAKALDDASTEQLTSTGLALGTPAYMSPEQASAMPVDARSDIYALGCVLYEMLAGEPPFTGRTAQAIVAKRLSQPVPHVRSIRDTVPEALDRVVEVALAKVPADRFATVRAMVEALSTAAADRSAPAADRRARARRLGVTVALSLVAMTAGLAGWRLLSTRSPAVPPAAAVLAVLPFTPAGTDTALTRLGRDLASTVSASLDGVGDIRAVDRLTILAQTQEHDAPISLRAGALLGQRLGAMSVVHGSLTRDGARVRVDVGLYTTDSLLPLGRGSALAPPESLSALTDSVVWKLLANIWRHGEPPTPTLEAITTRSVEALRAFLDGEREAVAGHGDAAYAAYGRAIASDSSFWFAYFRQGNVMGWAEEDVDSATEHAYWSHRHLLPQRERMLIEAFRGDSGFSRQRAQLEQIVDRYPDYWPAWWALGDGLLHNYPHIGSTADDTRKALERVVTLNPVMVTAWEHLLWAASDQRDTAMQARALERLERLHAGPTILQNERMDKLLAYRTVLALQRRSLESEVMLDSMYQDVLRPGRDKFVPGIVLQGSGMPAAQIDFNRRLLRHGLAPEDARNVAHGIALAWAMRGSWDSALVARDHLVQSATDTLGLLNVYRTAVLATFVGALPAQEAARRRPAVARLVPFQPAGYQAELAWLDGVLAAANRDRTALAAARVRLSGTGAEWTTFLDRSLGAFDLALRGKRSAAATAMAALEWELADGSPWFAFHPSTPHLLFRGIDRMAAAEWLLAEGDSTQAMRLLQWHRTMPPFDDKMPLRPLAELLQGRIEDGQGDTAAARHHYEDFLLRYDRPVQAHRHLVDEALAALARLSGRPALPLTE